MKTIYTFLLAFSLLVSGASTARAEGPIARAAKVNAILAAVDLATTDYNAIRWGQSAREMNPILRMGGGSVAGRNAVSVGLEAGTVWAVGKWVAPRHPKIAKVLIYGQAVAHGVASAYNVSEAIR